MRTSRWVSFRTLQAWTVQHNRASMSFSPNTALCVPPPSRWQFNLTGRTLWVESGAVLDYESGVTAYLVVVLILDNGSPPMNTTYGFDVQVRMWSAAGAPQCMSLRLLVPHCVSAWALGK